MAEEKDVVNDVNNESVETATESSVQPEIQAEADDKGKKKKMSKKERKECDEIEKLKAQVAELTDKQLRLFAEFDNYRKRTIKEKGDLIKTGGESALLGLLPVVDDFERAIKSVETATTIEAVKEGVMLIYGKFREYLTQQGIREIEMSDQVFNPDLHEAITRFPAPSEELKGKIIDTVQKGYSLHDKVIRYAKVVVGE